MTEPPTAEAMTNVLNEMELSTKLLDKAMKRLEESDEYLYKDVFDYGGGRYRHRWRRTLHQICILYDSESRALEHQVLELKLRKYQKENWDKLAVVLISRMIGANEGGKGGFEVLRSGPWKGDISSAWTEFKRSIEVDMEARIKEQTEAEGAEDVAAGSSWSYEVIVMDE
ncbi:hypothetical protein NA57DRAFT_70092 [Rhizodiscina lignyota]|uniref:Uncharacterized protein n=1 Tax=Rhizodiscina lignyota TaxID=1504668 RepID=A0A9P4IPX2_9PEZI|nr:hypothetical protein NA57DRAFT_70092 [Rhizodiscina lignyota]